MFICGVVLRDAFVFKRIFETLIINLGVISHAGIPYRLMCYLTVMLGSDRVV